MAEGIDTTLINDSSPLGGGVMGPMESQEAIAKAAAENEARLAEQMSNTRKPVNFQGAPAWWNLGGQQTSPAQQAPQIPQLPTAPLAPPSNPQIPQNRPEVQFADVSNPRYALGIPNWRNYSSALRR